MVTKTKYPGICNNCGRKSEYYIRTGIHSIQLCGTCLQKLKAEAITLLATTEDANNDSYNNSVETGLIASRKRQCSPQMIAEADCDGDPNCRKCYMKKEN